MYVIVGLGNPGDKYKLNRHNFGFMAIDTIADSYSFSAFRSNFNAHISEGKLGTERVILCKPNTYMNNSGKAIQALLAFYKILPEKVYVIHDDLNINLGDIRLKLDGGSGGHNGLKSIDQHIGSAYFRLRLGIGHPGIKDEVTNYVLSNFSQEEEDTVISCLASLAKNIGSIFHLPMNEWLKLLSV